MTRWWPRAAPTMLLPLRFLTLAVRYNPQDQEPVRSVRITPGAVIRSSWVAQCKAASFMDQQDPMEPVYRTAIRRCNLVARMTRVAIAVNGYRRPQAINTLRPWQPGTASRLLTYPPFFRICPNSPRRTLVFWPKVEDE